MSVILIDHYQANAAYLGGVASRDFRLAVIDDVADRDLRAADWILNQNPAAAELAYQVRDDCRLLRGPEFALLRTEFPAARSNSERSIRSDDHRVLVTLGGSDVAGKMKDILVALGGVERRLEVRCVVAGAVESSELSQVADDSRQDVRVLCDVADMAGQMAWADVSINAGGSTCWELCCLGVPMVVAELSADQARNAEFLGEREIAVSLGTWDRLVTPKAAARAVDELLGDTSRREAMSARGKSLVDGLGANRVAESLAILARTTCEAVR